MATSWVRTALSSLAVQAANAVKSAASLVLLVQNVDEDGDTFVIEPANSSHSATDSVLWVQPLDASGNVILGGGGSGGGSGVSSGGYSVAQQDFSAAYTSATTLTLTGLPFTPNDSQWVSVDVTLADGTKVSYPKGEDYGFTFVAATGVLTVTGASFLNTDLAYDVTILGVPKGYDSTGNQFIDWVSNPNWEQRTAGITLADVTDGTDGSGTTYEYTVDMANFRRLGIQFVLDPGSGTPGSAVVCTIRASWKPGAATADCVDVTPLFGVTDVNDADTGADTVLIDVDGLLAEATLILVRVEATTGDNSGDWHIYYGVGY